MSSLEIAVRSLVGSVFLVSSLSKARNRAAYRKFVQSAARLWMGPPALERLTVHTVLGAEFATWMLLAVPTEQTGRTGLLLAAGLLIAFTFAVAWTLYRGNSLACNCFGESTTPLGGWHIVRNVLLAAGAIGCLLAPPHEPPGGGHTVVAALAGVSIGLVTTALDDISALFQPLLDTGTGPVTSPPPDHFATEAQET